MTSKSVLLGAAVLLVAGAGLASVVLKSGGDDVEPEPVVIAQANEVMKTIPQEPTQAQREFQSMAVSSDEILECELPTPPKSIGQTALTRNSLRQVLRIVALQKWKETGSCECVYHDVGWDDVLDAAPRFERTDGVDLRFDLSSLRAQADELEAQRQSVCSE